MLRSFFTISFFTFISRIFGFVRDIIFAFVMGAGPLTEAFIVAFKLPNFFRRLFGEGAFNSVFVPMFSHKMVEEGERGALVFASKIFTILLSVLVVFTIIFQISMPFVMYLFAPGFANNTEQFDLVVLLSRITFPYLLFISLVSLLAGMQNSIKRFAASSATPIILNLCIISGLLFYAEIAPTAAHGAAIAVFIAGILQFLWMWFSCRRFNQKIKIQKIGHFPDGKIFFKRIIPGIIGAGVMQINLWIDIIIATFIPGAVAYLYYADRINQLPLAVIGIALGTALLPIFSKKYKQGKFEEAINTQNRAIELAMFLVLPAMAAFLVVSYPIISVLFERGEFTSSNALATSYALSAYAIGLPAFVLLKVFIPSFFARGDTKTPMKVAVISLLLNSVLNIVLVFLFLKLGYMPHIGLALATSIAAWVNLIIIVKLLIKSDMYHADSKLKKRIIATIFSSIIMAGFLFIALQHVPISIVGLLILITGGALVFLTCAAATKAIPRR